MFKTWPGQFMCIRKDQWSNAAAIKRSISDIDTDAPWPSNPMKSLGPCTYR